MKLNWNFSVELAVMFLCGWEEKVHQSRTPLCGSFGATTASYSLIITL